MKQLGGRLKGTKTILFERRMESQKFGPRDRRRNLELQKPKAVLRDGDALQGNRRTEIVTPDLIELMIYKAAERRRIGSRYSHEEIVYIG